MVSCWRQGAVNDDDDECKPIENPRTSAAVLLGRNQG